MANRVHRASSKTVKIPLTSVFMNWAANNDQRVFRKSNIPFRFNRSYSPISLFFTAQLICRFSVSIKQQGEMLGHNPPIILGALVPRLVIFHQI